MKRLLTILLLGVLLLCGVGMCCQSCDSAIKHHRQNTERNDSLKFQELLVKCLPSAQRKIYLFSDVTDVVAYKLERERQHSIDSIFLTLTDQQLANISAVLLRHKKRFSISELVTEYNAYKRVYDGLPEESPDSPPTKIVEFKALEIDNGSVQVNLDSTCKRLLYFTVVRK